MKGCDCKSCYNSSLFLCDSDGVVAVAVVAVVADDAANGVVLNQY